MSNKKDLTFYNLKERKWLTRLDRGSIVGHTTSCDTKLWFRFKSKGKYLLVLSKTSLKDDVSKKPKEIESLYTRFSKKLNDNLPLHCAVEVTVDGTSDFTCVLNTFENDSISKLDEDSIYYYGAYNLDEENWEIGVENSHSFRTMPKNEIAKSWDISFGLYSCHMPFDPKNESKSDASMWDLMEKELKFSNAKFVIGGGDQVYCDGVDYLNIWNWLKKVKKDKPTIDDMYSWYRDIYRGYWGFPGVKAVHRQFPNYMTWDDHEIMDGWGSYTKDELSNELDTIFEWENKKTNLKLASNMFKAATHVYKEYQHSHNPKRENVKDCFDYDFNTCGSDFFVLDMRGKRNFDENYTILGKNQMKRFLDWSKELENSNNKGPIFVVSTVPMVHLKDFVSNILDWVAIFGARDDVRDHWAHEKHGKEFIKILNTIFKASHNTKRPLVVLSGDVHIGGIFKLFSDKKKHKNAKVFQLTSSAITYAAVGPLKMGLLAKATAQAGTIGKNSSFRFERETIFPQHNFSLINYKTDENKTTQINIELIGKSEDSRVKESVRISLLDI